MTVIHIFLNKMAVTMALFWVSFVLAIIGSNADGELSILHNPQSLKFSGSSKMLESNLKEVFSASLGLSVEENSEWEGLYITDPFKTPEAVVEVYVDGVSNLGHTGLKAIKFPLTVDEYEPDTYEAVAHRIKQRFTNGGNKLININLSDANQLSSASFAHVFGGELKTKMAKQSLSHLKYSVEEDYQFLSEVETIKAIAERVKNGVITSDNIIDFYNFRFRSLHALCDYHGPNSLQAKEAKKIMAEALQELSDAFVKAYDGSVLVTAVTTDVAHTRRAVRSAENGDSDVNIVERSGEAEDAYSGDYPAIFNIILWFGVVFSFTLIAIVYAIMDMDPGRDSIIYRMTSTRIKKDN